MSDPTAHKMGMVSLLGRPNAGKSTLMNKLVGAKLAIVSDKPQTTRTSIQGVLTTPEAQIVFIDTPGIHRSDSTLNKRMMNSVRNVLDSLDLVLFLADASSKVTEEDERAVDLLKKVESPSILVLNKIDLIDNKSQLLPVLARYQQMHEFTEYIPVSATTGENLDQLSEVMARMLPEGEALYPEDHITDQPERYLAAEYIREKILLETRQEVPHAVAVIVESWQETPKLLKITATIYVERAGQKGIIIGSQGAMLKKIGTAARQELEEFFGRKIFLELFVKVKANWRESSGFLNEIDWRGMAGTDDE